MPRTKESGIDSLVQETLDRAVELNKAITDYNTTESVKRRGHPLHWSWERRMDKLVTNLVELRERCPS